MPQTEHCSRPFWSPLCSFRINLELMYGTYSTYVSESVWKSFCACNLGGPGVQATHPFQILYKTIMRVWHIFVGCESSEWKKCDWNPSKRNWDRFSFLAFHVINGASLMSDDTTQYDDLKGFESEENLWSSWQTVNWTYTFLSISDDVV